MRAAKSITGLKPMGTNDGVEQSHWSGRGRAVSAGSSDVMGRPHRSVLALGKMNPSAIVGAVVTVLKAVAVEQERETKRKIVRFLFFFAIFLLLVIAVAAWAIW